MHVLSSSRNTSQNHLGFKTFEKNAVLGEALGAIGPANQRAVHVVRHRVEWEGRQVDGDGTMAPNEGVHSRARQVGEGVRLIDWEAENFHGAYHFIGNGQTEETVTQRDLKCKKKKAEAEAFSSETFWGEIGT